MPVYSALLFLLYFLEGLADHHRPPADRLVVVGRREVAIDVEHGLAAGDRCLGLSRADLGRPIDREGDGRTVGAERDDERAVDRGALDAASIHEDAVAALAVAHDPAVVLVRHLDVLAADAAVVDPHVAVEFAADHERPHQAKFAAVEGANGETRRDRRAGGHAQFFVAAGPAGALNDWIMCIRIGSSFAADANWTTPSRRNMLRSTPIR